MNIVKLNLNILLSSPSLSALLELAGNDPLFLKGGVMRALIWKQFKKEEIDVLDIDCFSSSINLYLKAREGGLDMELKEKKGIKEMAMDHLQNVDCTLNRGCILLWKGNLWFFGDVKDILGENGNQNLIKDNCSPYKEEKERWRALIMGYRMGVWNTTLNYSQEWEEEGILRWVKREGRKKVENDGRDWVAFLEWSKERIGDSKGRERIKEEIRREERKREKWWDKAVVWDKNNGW
jgi:hypothetical protein